MCSNTVFKNKPIDKADLFNCYFYDQISDSSDYDSVILMLAGPMIIYLILISIVVKVKFKIFFITQRPFIFMSIEHN